MNQSLLSYLFGVCLWLIGTLGTTYAQQTFWQPQRAYTDAESQAGYEFVLDESQLTTYLQQVPSETAARVNNVTLQLPLPNGELLAYRLVEAPIMHPSLAARYGIRSYSGQSPAGAARMSMTPEGLHAFLFHEEGTVVIEPMGDGIYRSYHETHTHDAHDALAACGVDKTLEDIHEETAARSANFEGELYDYRLALATSAEYSQFHGGTLASVMNALTVAMTYINGVLERDVAIRLSMIANNDDIIFFDPDTDPYTYNALGTNLGENQAALNQLIGSANYDIGHVFTQVTPPPGGSYTAGIASLGSVCGNNSKARGASSQPAPNGESFYQIAAHEIGHQFAAGHTWNANAGSCTGGQYSPSTAWEPGSGSTIMSYVGVCGPHNITSQRDGYFNGGTIEQMYNFSRGPAACANVISITNQAPTVQVPDGGVVVPHLTPFLLQGTATDPEGDDLTYCWEQYDLGPPGDPAVPVDNAPLFRSWLPRENGDRYFPRLANLLNNTTVAGEYIPDYNREMTFRLSVRDNFPGAGAVTRESVTFSITDQAGPFVVMAPNTSGVTWTAGSVQEVRWDVALTNTSPVNCSQVDVLLSTDGGFTYPYVLAEHTPNDGVVNVVVPDVAGVNCRVMVKAVDNFFLDVSNANFAIDAAGNPDFNLFNPEQAMVVCAGEVLEFEVIAQPQGGFNLPVDLLANNIPPGMTVSFSPAQVQPGDPATVQVSTDATLAAGAYEITQFGIASGGPTDLQPITIEVSNANIAAVQLASPANGLRSASRQPYFRWAELVGALTYDIEISLTPDFSQTVLLVEGLIEPEYRVIDALADEQVYFWRVKALDACQSVISSQVFAFQTGACRRASETYVPPREISALGAPITLFSSLSIGLNGSVADVNVTEIKGTHNSVRDLKADLISPDGTRVSLFDQICANEDQNFRLGFDDEADVSSLTCPPTQGQLVQSATALSTFNGESAGGPWRLELSDVSQFDGGQWYGWSLEVCTDLPTAPTLIKNEGLAVALPGGTGLIDSLLLRTIDASFSGNDLTYTVVEPPRNGDLRRGAFFLQTGSTFSQETIDGNLFGYTHTAGQGAQDSFTFVVSNPNGGWLGTPTFYITIDGVTSIKANETELAWNVYPVPAQSELHVDVTEALREEAEVILYDLKGASLRQARIVPGKQELTWEVGDLPAGLYLLQVRHHGRVSSRKVSIE